MGLVYYTCTDQRFAHSAAEDAFIARLQEAGIPVVPGVKLANNWVFDGAINGTRVLVEYHGDYWHTRPEVAERDGRKQVWAEQEGYTIVTVWEHEDLQDPDAQLHRVMRAYVQALALQAEAAVAAAEAAASTLPAPVLSDTSDRSDTESALPAWTEAFLAGLRATRTVLGGCLKAGIHRSTFYAALKGNVALADAVKWAKQDAADLIFEKYAARGDTQSDRAAERAMAILDRDTYGDVTRVEHSGPDGGPIAIDSAALAAAAQELAAWRQQMTEQLSSPNSSATPPTPATTTG